MLGNVTSAREALMAELLRDVDALLERLEQLDAELAARIEQATKDAAGKAYLTTRLNLDAMFSEQERKRIEAGVFVAARIEERLSGSSSLGSQASGGPARVPIAYFTVGVLTSGALGGFIGAVGPLRIILGR